MTLKEISEKIGFTSSQWNNYELGYSYPKFLDLITISQYFEISETELIHSDLEISYIGNLKEEKSQNEIISLQSKIINLQQEKINELEVKLVNIKNNPN